MLRSFKTSKGLLDYYMVFIVLGFLTSLIYSQIWVLWYHLLDHCEKIEQVRSMVVNIFAILFIMFFWSYVTSVISDPGKVPLYWGFFLDDPEHRKRRYCLICHIFKPERCHHCSTCNRCVLNMDHHCPWLNNCIGFYNRKFFILMLAYSILNSLYLFLSSLVGIAYLLKTTPLNKLEDQSFWLYEAFVGVGFFANLVFFFVMIAFFKFHIQLILVNTTTIENLDKQRNPDTQNHFDIGKYYNFVQVMGRNPWLWPFPIFLNSGKIQIEGKPVGDGVLWPQKNKKDQNITIYSGIKKL